MSESPHLIMDNVLDDPDTFVTSQEANVGLNEDINIDDDIDER